MAADIAIMASLFTSVPSGKTADILSTSVSKMSPKSALFFITADWIERMASGFSGFGM